MGDTSNWEFAAAVAGVCIGLGGLLLFTIVATIGSWRVFEKASRAANEAAKANVAMQGLVRELQERPLAGTTPALDLSAAANSLSDLRRQADTLMEQQQRLQEAVRNLVEAGVLGSRETNQQMTELEGVMRRLEDQLARVSAAMAGLGQRPS